MKWGIMQLFLALTGLLSMIYVTSKVRKRLFAERESLAWQLLGILMLLLGIFPDLLIVISGWLGVDYPPSLLFLLAILVLFCLSLRQSQQVSRHSAQEKELGQQLALLQERVRVLEAAASETEPGKKEETK